MRKRFFTLVAGVLAGAMIINPTCAADNVVYASEKNAFADEPQWDSYDRTIFNTTNGLMSNNVSSVSQSANGLVWIGTDAGLETYDGTEFFEYGSFFHFDGINDILLCPDGNMWYATTTYGAAINLESRFQHFDDVSLNASNNSLSICMGPDGKIYDGTTRYMVSISPAEGFTVTELKANGLTGVCTLTSGEKYVAGANLSGKIFFLENGEIVFSEDRSEDPVCAVEYINGCFVAGTKNGRIVIYPEKDLNKGCIEIDTGKKDQINSFYVDENRLWVLFENQVGYYKLGNDFSLEKISGAGYTSMYFDDFESGYTDMMVDYQGNYWFTSSKRGLLLLGASYFYNEFAALGEKTAGFDTINAVVKSQGGLLVATKNGVEFISDNGTITDGFAGKNVTDICDMGSLLALSVYGEGVYVFDSKALIQGGTYKMFIPCEKLVSGRINALKIQNWNGVESLFVCTKDGFSVISTKELTKASGDIVLENYGSDCGLYNSDVTTILTGQYGKKHSENTDSEKTYVCTDGGAIFVFEAGKIVDQIDENNGVTSKAINDILEYNGGFFAATDRGLFYYNGKKIVTFEKYIEGIENSPLETLIIDGEILYAAGDEELYLINIDTLFGEEEDAVFSSFNPASGYRATISNAADAVLYDGKLYIPFENTLYSLERANLVSSSEKIKILVQSVKSDKVSVAIGENNVVTVPSDTKELSIYCSVLAFANENPSLRYIMPGVDREYTVIDRAHLEEIIYENLEGGEYKFYFQLLDDKGEPADTLILTIIKEKKLFEILWFRMLLLAAGFGVLMYYVFRKKQIHIDKNSG